MEHPYESRIRQQYLLTHVCQGQTPWCACSACRFIEWWESGNSIMLFFVLHAVFFMRLQERLGHSTIAITMDTYSHVLPSMHQDVARKLGDMFEE